MTPSGADVRDVRIIQGLGVGEKAMECPECGRGLPIDQWTKCDRCGAHLSLKVGVEVPGQDV